ncbi:S41 family peptidase [uncultured Alistipes sp.]|uniref:S41 family peptidase n=1 Tax=uncultured Alistipes sp. TaxID=538949 RepID=UPI002805EE5A|nr:S41 family peptidase [uncultured Alistipes sp.]
MKRNLRFLLLLCSLWMLAALPVQAQQMANASSGFSMTSDDLSDPRVPGNLETLCRVWGYAKYHHPVFCDTLCRVDVDSALFALLPKVVHADRDTRNRHLLDWVRSLGAYTPNRVDYEQSLAPLELVSTVDLAWTRDTILLGCDLSHLLQDLRYAERGENYYLRMGTMENGPGYHYLSLRNEKSYPTPQMDSGLNLLTLFRLWNVIEYYAPNRSLTLHPWEEVLTSYIPRMGVETDPVRFSRLYFRLIRELNDGHAYAPIEMLFGQRMLPVWPLQAEGRLFVGYSGDSALKRGDEVVAIDGEPISERLELLREYASRSNEASLRQALRFYGLCTRRDTAEVVRRRAGACDTLRVATVPYGSVSPLYDPAQLEQPPFRLLADSVGYIYAGTFSREYLAEVGQTLPRTRALIIDLRTYPLNVDGALIALAAQSLCTEPVVAWQTLHQTLALPGLFFRQEQWLDNGFEEGAAQCTEPYKGRVILLVNELTQSNPEFQAMALQRCPQTLTIGSPTSGADGDIVSLPLPGGLMTYFSGIGIFYPDGTPTQNVGVRLDIEVLPTAEGLQAGRGEVLERALELARQ